jgi:hypothetical protein
VDVKCTGTDVILCQDMNSSDTSTVTNLRALSLDFYRRPTTEKLECELEGSQTKLSSISDNFHGFAGQTGLSETRCVNL